MKITALKYFYADHFKTHISEGETVAIAKHKDPKKEAAAKKAARNYIQAGLAKEADSGAKVGKRDPKKAVAELIKGRKKEAKK
jgi:hypothetical protein